KHIIKRAAVLKRSDMIPANWNPDGSRKDAKVQHIDVDWTAQNQRELEIHTRVASGRPEALERSAVFLSMSAWQQAQHKGVIEHYSREMVHALRAQRER